MTKRKYIPPIIQAIILPTGRQLLAGSNDEQYKVTDYNDGGEETIGGDGTPETL